MAFALTEARFVEALTSATPVGAVGDFTSAVKVARIRESELDGERSHTHLVSERNPLTIDLDAAASVSHSENKDGAPGIWKRTYGHHPLFAFVDYGPKQPARPWHSCNAPAILARTLR